MRPVGIDAAERTVDKGLGSPVLFVFLYTSLASAVYFSLGVIADHALGLTPVVFLAGGLLFGLAAMTYVEGASMHQDRAGSTVFARYAFNELVSFVAGWALLLDYLILIAATSFTATNYAAAFYAPLGRGTTELVLGVAIVVYAALRNVFGFGSGRVRRLVALVGVDLLLQLVIIVLGLIVFFRSDLLLDPIDLGTAPSWEDMVFALGLATVVSTGLESASARAGEVGVGRTGLRRLVTSATGVMLVVYVGIALVALTALPVVDGRTALGDEHLDAPVLGITGSFEQSWLADTLTYVVAGVATITLVAAANTAMLGVSRLAYNLARNRQIPSRIGRLHPTRSTPYVAIALGAVIAIGLLVPADLDALLGLYAFGALLSLTIAHVSIIALRFREPDRRRPYRIPVNVRVRGIPVPLPAVLGAAGSAVAWISVLLYHSDARWAGLVWMTAGLVLYVGYRRSEDKPVFRRVVVPEEALRAGESGKDVSYGSILVPVFGTPLDDDIIQTAGRLAGQWHDDFDDEEGATIEALWVFEIPIALPLDGRLPDRQLERARAALRRAKAVGEEYEGVEVATATVRARRAGAAIVDEARRRGVEAIVLAAEEPSRMRSGATLGGRGVRENFVGETTKYVLAKAPCQVILTAPPADDPLLEEARSRPAAGDGGDASTAPAGR